MLEDGGAGLEVTFEPDPNKRPRTLSYCYTGRNHRSSFKIKGVLEHLGRGDRCYFGLGLCHPNRLDYAGFECEFASRDGPWAFKLTVLLLPKGCMSFLVVSDGKGQRQYHDDFAWADPPWLKKVVRRQGSQRPGWIRYHKMKECGWAVTARDAMRIRDLYIRPLNPNEE